MMTDHDDDATTASDDAATTDDDRNLSNDRPMESQAARQYSPEWWEARNDVGRCKSIRRNGQRCLRPRWAGTTVCGHHGARAPQVRRKARQRLEEATDRMAKELLRMAIDPDVSDAVKLRAITEALDRGNLSAKTEIEISAKPFEQIEESAAATLEITSRAAFRRAQGKTGEDCGTDESDEGDPLADLIAQDRAKAMADSNRRLDPNVIDAETVEIVSDVTDYGDPHGQPGGFGIVGPHDGPMTLVEANAVVAEINRRNAERWQHENANRAKIHRPRRALPPGRSG